MKIAINARNLHSPSLRGWNRYTINLLAELSALDLTLYLYSDLPIHPTHLSRLRPGSYQLRLGPARLSYDLWEQVWLPRQCREDRIEILHCPVNFGLPALSPCPRVLTLHDAIDQRFIGPNRRIGDGLRPAALRSALRHWISRTRAERVITVSEHSRRDLERELGIPGKKLRVTYEAADPRFHAPLEPADLARVRERLALPERYVFYIGGWEPRKNLPALLRGFALGALPDTRLVLAGGTPAQREELLAHPAARPIASRLRLLDWIDDPDLPALYAGSLCFVYPSDYEGFGLQLCEAMACGCPILASDRTSLPEIIGNAGALFSNDDPSRLAELLRRVELDESYRRELIQKGRARSLDFSWSRTAEATLAVYRELAGSGRSAAR